MKGKVLFLLLIGSIVVSGQDTQCTGRDQIPGLKDQNEWKSNYELYTELLDAGVPTASIEDLNLNRQALRIPYTDPFFEGVKGLQGAFKWNSGDDGTKDWYPQGVTVPHALLGDSGSDVNDVDANDYIAVSWYSKETPNKGVRISIVDPTTLKYRHVLLVVMYEDNSPPTGADSAPNYMEVPVHAGGIALVGDLLHVADTWNGIRTFNMSMMMEVQTSQDVLGLQKDGKYYAYQYRYIIPQVNTYLNVTGVDPRYSFVSASLDYASGEGLLTLGEYESPATDGRIFQYNLDITTGKLQVNKKGLVQTPSECCSTPGEDRMQGGYYDYSSEKLALSCSSQVGSIGALYVSGSNELNGPYKQNVWVYGCEDLTKGRACCGFPQNEVDGMYTLTEHLNNRTVFSVDPLFYFKERE